MDATAPRHDAKPQRPSPHQMGAVARAALALLGVLLALSCVSDATRTSMVAPSAAGAPSKEPGETPPRRTAGWSEAFALVTAAAEPHLVLGEVGLGDVAHGPLRLADHQGHIVHAAIPEAELTPGMRHWHGRRVEVVTDRGARCAASVGALEYRVDLVPDEYEASRWEGISDDASERLQPPRGTERARAVWDSSTSRMITAGLRLDRPEACEGEPLYARDLTQAPARIAVPVAAVPRRAAVLEAFRSLPAYRRAQAEYAALVRDDPEGADLYPPLWEDEEREVAVQAFAFPEADGVLVSVSAPFVYCSNADWALWAVFRVEEGTRAPQLVDLSTTVAPEGVRLILDAGGHGFDYLVDGGFPGGTDVVRGDATLASWSPEFHGCGC